MSHHYSQEVQLEKVKGDSSVSRPKNYIRNIPADMNASDQISSPAIVFFPQISLCIFMGDVFNSNKNRHVKT